MSNVSKEERIRELRGASMAGDTGMSSQAGDPRRHRNAQGDLAFEQRFNRDQFRLNSDQQVELELRSRPAEVRVAAVNMRGEEGSGELAPEDNLGFITGPMLSDTSDVAFWRWVIPADIDTKRPVKAELRWVETSAASQSYAIDLDAFAYTRDVDQFPETSATESAQFSGTTANNKGFESGGELILTPSLFLVDSVAAIWFHGTLATAPASVNFICHTLFITYSSRFYHTHEKP